MKNNTSVSAEKADINSLGSSKEGVLGIFENILRRFQTPAFLFLLLPIVFACIISIGVSLAPGIYLFQWVVELTVHSTAFAKAFYYGFALATGAVLFTFTLVLVVPILNLPCLPFVKAFRGAWVSFESIPWYYHNALTYLVRYTVLDFLTPSPINIFFFRMMGMKIGKGVLLNTSNISDPCLIVIEDYVTIGGSVFMMAHYGMKGYLIVDKLHIKKGAMVGLTAKILGGVTIGEKAVVAPNVAVLPKTIIKDGEKYGLPPQTDPNNLSAGAV